jgi:hypothetical protein
MLQPSGPVQSTYNRYLAAAQNGMPASESGWDVDTKIFEENASPAAGVGYGIVVQQGVADRGARIAGSGIVVGITIANVSNQVNVFTDKYAAGQNMGVAVRGDWWFTAEDAVVAGEAVYFNATTGVLGHSGGTLLTNARWMTSAAAGGVAVLRIENPGYVG